MELKFRLVSSDVFRVIEIMARVQYVETKLERHTKIDLNSNGTLYAIDT